MGGRTLAGRDVEKDMEHGFYAEGHADFGEKRKVDRRHCT